jgi:hypothetical protein
VPTRIGSSNSWTVNFTASSTNASRLVTPIPITMNKVSNGQQPTGTFTGNSYSIRYTLINNSLQDNSYQITLTTENSAGIKSDPRYLTFIIPKASPIASSAIKKGGHKTRKRSRKNT